MYNFAAALFDMDGLIFDTEKKLKQCWQQAANRQGLNLTDDDYQTFVGTKDSECEIFIQRLFGEKVNMAQYIQDRDQLYSQIKTTPPELMSGFKALFTQLQHRNIPCALVTSSSRQDVEFNFSTTDYLKKFTVIVTGDDVKKGKPDPECYQLACQQLGVLPAHGIVFEDSNQGMKSAHLAGCQAIMIPDLVPANAESLQSASYVAKDLNQVAKWLFNDNAHFSPR